MANKILSEMSDYGESRETLETNWEKWIHHLPFDTRVAAALDRLYEARLGKLDPERDQTPYHRLEKKRTLLQERINRYRTEVFVGRAENARANELAPVSRSAPNAAMPVSANPGMQESNG